MKVFPNFRGMNLTIMFVKVVININLLSLAFVLQILWHEYLMLVNVMFCHAHNVIRRANGEFLTLFKAYRSCGELENGVLTFPRVSEETQSHLSKKIMKQLDFSHQGHEHDAQTSCVNIDLFAKRCDDV